MRLLLFAGASEGRILAERLAGTPVRVDISVATKYGGEVLAGVPKSGALLVGRKDEEEIRLLLANGGYDLVVDATHPFAVTASRHIAAAAKREDVPYIRLVRDRGPSDAGEVVPSIAAAAERLRDCEGNILVTTGSTTLAPYAAIPGYAERVHVRALPTVEALRNCAAAGIPPRRVIAMQGPFSRELNRALMRRFAISVLVTKDGGEAGGFGDKIAAAGDVGALVLVVGRPPGETGLPLEEAYRRILDMLKGRT